MEKPLEDCWQGYLDHFGGGRGQRHAFFCGAMNVLSGWKTGDLEEKAHAIAAELDAFLEEGCMCESCRAKRAAGMELFSWVKFISEPTDA
jgi:hypothetical protein